MPSRTDGTPSARSSSPRARTRRGARLPRAFFERPATVVARDLLGRVLVHDAPGGPRAGRIVEVEAYRGLIDPASHAYRGRTERNGVMFGRAGHAYVYLSYGIHHCLNLVCEPAGSAAAVLIRALEPLQGLDAMMRARSTREGSRLARGPGCVAQALGLDRRHDGLDLARGPLWVSAERPERTGRKVTTGPRIGISKGLDRPWRFYLAGHPCVSATNGSPPR
jgi:DNA-3-methyladenine glycosylase